MSPPPSAASGRGRRSVRIERSGAVRAFDAHAPGYDRLFAGRRSYHEHLRLTTRRMGLADQGRGLRLLDLGCGTGASTAALLDAAPYAEVVAIDASAEMLAVARGKTWPAGVRFVHGNVENLALAGVAGPFDGVLAAGLVRDLVHLDAALRGFLAALAPGSPIAVHEYSVRDSLRARMRWNTACWGWIIPLAKARSGSAELHRYLRRSAVEFDGADAFARRLESVGFSDVRVQTVPGWQQHVVHTFLGRRPAEEPVQGSVGPVPGGVAGAGDDEVETPAEGIRAPQHPG